MASEGHSDLPEVRLVLLGRAGAGTGSVGNTILGKQAFQGDVKASQQEKAVVAEKQVIVIASPDWYSSASTSADVQRHVSSFVSLSTPGPQAFLLCVPVNKPADGEAKALDTMEQLFGPTSISKHTIVLFTHTDELKEGEKLEEYLSTNRKDLLELVKRCGGRQFVLTNKDGGSVADLLKTVEETVKKSGVTHFMGSLYKQAETRVKEQIAKQMKAGEKPGEPGKESGSIPLELMNKVRESAQKTIHDNLNTNKPLPIVLRAVGLFVSIYAQLAVWMPKVSRLYSQLSELPSLVTREALTEALMSRLSKLRSLVNWEALKAALMSWLSKLPSLVSREALLQPLISLFVGGRLGDMLGATVETVTTEVEKRQEADK